MAPEVHVDGRNARRERSRDAVIDAAFALIREGKLPPSVDDLAERAGVSVSSIFRIFDGIADVQRQAFEAFQPRFAHLFLVDDADLGRSERVRSHVRARVALAEEAGGLILIVRSRALDHEPMIEGMARLRGRLAAQTRERFAQELGQLSTAEAANLASLVDAATSPGVFEVMGGAHARTSRQIATSWVAMLDALFAQWIPAGTSGKTSMPTPSGDLESRGTSA